MQHLKDRVVIVTGAGGGLGREHALLFAREGAKVVVNDLGGASAVVDEIRASGGEAVANTDSVADWAGAERIVRTAVEEFGDLHALVNNAGILRDRMLVSMTESDWDSVITVHLKGTFACTRHAAGYWRQKAKETGGPVEAAIVCTSSGSGLLNGVAQSNYGAAKAGIAAFAQIAAKELSRYGVRVNTIAPVARTPMTAPTEEFAEMFRPPADADAFDVFDAANVSPLVVYLASTLCPYTGGVWQVMGGEVGLFEGWQVVASLQRESRWSVEELRKEIAGLVGARASAEGKLLSEAKPFAGWEATLREPR
ncbi:SDR family NAD(P)-dependent oxidoreductase [Amycolatopsis sp. K13G38]|uniref:SDR family NAD(P)-dependent oxidoreductase n=1 Tax=Amycolatopsis acididurans TaxID=2724524 RepID=A0ABX1JEA7_9PSEU|nr:SDR family NAD(P)-dependent oxidoreductase [Amycolatopsis acididurans]NKQ58041.1 SDR family NAD(P)-dependent oxidoreductase [Amycolatopsis acididurans]